MLRLANADKFDFHEHLFIFGNNFVRVKDSMLIPNWTKDDGVLTKDGRKGEGPRPSTAPGLDIDQVSGVWLIHVSLP